MPFVSYSFPSADDIRKPAEAAMENMETSNLVVYVGNLAQVLADETAPTDIRSLAGITLKNCASARSSIRKKELAARWLSQDSNLRHQIHVILLNTLNSPVKEVRNASSLAVAAFAAIELPHNQWTDLISVLVQAISNQVENVDFVCACFNSIGYIIDALDVPLDAESINCVLNAIFTAVQPKMPAAIIHSAIRALCNSIPNCSESFKKDDEARMIMGMIVGVFAIDSEDIQDVAWQCLVQIASQYYETSNALLMFMDNIYQLSIAAISQVSAKPRPAVQALEFWITLAEVESDISYEIETSGEEDRPFFKFCAQACSKSLIETVCRVLLFQPEDPDDDDWCAASAAGLCLVTLVQLLGADIVHALLKVSTPASLEHADWRVREAATLVFGCLMESERFPEDIRLADLENYASFILSLFNDGSPHVRNTAVWTVSQICKYNINFLDNLHQQLGERLLSCLTSGEVKPAAYACIAINEIAEQFQPDKLTPFVTPFMNALLVLSDQHVETKLLAGAFEAISQLVKNCPEEMSAFITGLLPRFTQKLNELNNSSSIQHDASEELSALQGLVCGTLESIVASIQWEQFSGYADTLMGTLLTVMKSKSSIVHEEALLCIGQVARKAGLSFERYMETFCPILVETFSHVDELQLIQTALMTVSTLAASFESNFAPHAATLFSALEGVMLSPAIDKEAKLLGFDAYVDFALALGHKFEPFLPNAMQTISQAASIALWNPSLGDDLYEYCEKLTGHLIQCFIGFTTALCADNAAHLLGPYAEYMVQFALAVTQHAEQDEAQLAAVCDFFADIVSYAFDVSPTFYQFIFNSPLSGYLATKDFRSRSANKSLKRAKAVYQSFLQKGQIKAASNGQL